MLKLIALIGILAFCLGAAPWDGQRGPFLIYTWNPMLPPGVPPVPSVGIATVVSVVCSDPSISGVRVTISYHDEQGEHQASYLSAFQYGVGGIATSIPQAQITAVTLTELRDGATY